MKKKVSPVKKALPKKKFSPVKEIDEVVSLAYNIEGVLNTLLTKRVKKNKIIFVSLMEAFVHTRDLLRSMGEYHANWSTHEKKKERRKKNEEN